jgi:hypothetical protein
MGLIAAAMFVALFMYYDEIVGPMTGPNLHLALFCAFVFGIICGYQVKKKRQA